jgi:hypothetical protein
MWKQNVINDGQKYERFNVSLVVFAIFVFFYTLIEVSPAGIGFGSIQEVRVAGALHFDDKLSFGYIPAQNVNNALTGNGNLRILNGFNKLNVLNARVNTIEYVVQQLNQYVFMFLYTEQTLESKIILWI